MVTINDAAEMSTAMHPTTSGRMEENLNFVDDEKDMIVDKVGRNRMLDTDAIDLASLSTFLSRPVMIHDFQITEAPFTNFTIDPWRLFFDTPSIKRKLDNFNFLQADLHIKIVINASPFLFGGIMVSYRPLPAATPDPGVTFAANFGMVDSNFNGSLLIQSQCENILLLPQTNSGGEMTLPWFWPYNWLDATVASNFNLLGKLYFQQITPLQSANAETAFAIDAQVYAWATNVDVTGATTKLALQSKTEFKGLAKGALKAVGRKVASKAKKALPPVASEWGDKPVSKVATAVAKVSHVLSNVPIIGGMAKATELGATAVSKIANFFGFTNPPVIDNVTPMKNIPFHAMSTPDVSEPVETLTLDPKNELTIAPDSVDLSSQDELDVNYICSKEALIHVCYWRQNDPVLATLFHASITPCYQRVSVAPHHAARIPVPMCHIAQMFRYWRGDIIIRVKALCTQYHKGRISIAWDPTIPLEGQNATAYTTSFTQIVDLAPDMDISIRIPYLQARQWLNTNTIQDGGNFPFAGRWNGPSAALAQTSFTNLTAGVNCNGYLSVKVLNKLTGPTSGNQVAFAVYARAADNFELADPNFIVDARISGLVPQNKIEMASLASFQDRKEKSYGEIVLQGDITNTSSLLTNMIVAGSVNEPNPDANLMFMGEAVQNLRTLFRRQTYERSIGYVQTHSASTARRIMRTVFTKWPKSPGYNAGAYVDYTQEDGSGSARYSRTQHNPIEWVSLLFVGMRGKIRRTFNILGESPIMSDHLSISRRTEGAGSNETDIVANISNTLTYGQVTNTLCLPHSTTLSGYSLNNLNTQTGVTVELPHYYFSKFVYTNPNNQWRGNPIDGSNRESYYLHYLQYYGNNAESYPIVNMYVGAGTDFTMFYFLSTNVLYDINNLPTPV